MDLLNTFFNSEKLSDEAMYFFEMHGFLTSLVVQPGSLSQQQILSEILADNDANASIEKAIFDLQKNIEQALLNGEFPTMIGESEEPDEDFLTLWSSGFMQGVFMHEDLWFNSQPEDVAELTLPILACSELLDDEIDEITQNDDLLDDMAEKIPDCVIDLYLLFNSPEGT
ncbi:MAG: YecA family protein [Cycloclasticus pugetii]|jgi:uncharacterized protein|uniref:YecA/YgfB family protein n=1 Tax=Cycloclasticus TaxID=34067 RepID=UPI000286AFFA|nr:MULTISPECIES: YecA family protein [Cycloclasticus]AFT66591.1 metal-binding protein [Cycloclasticus sp. P1]SHI93961.1 uncharacterized protein SAMN05519226_1146 [Cycloclasticus pugetii]|tara:strand:- start:17 stop:526 length:510 start_codon:yes stop_codon:yes gene_type:complete